MFILAAILAQVTILFGGGTVYRIVFTWRAWRIYQVFGVSRQPSLRQFIPGVRQSPLISLRSPVAGALTLFFVLYLFPFFSLPIGGQHFYVVVIAARFASLSFLIPFFLYLSLLWAPASGEAFYLSWFRYKRFRGSGGGSGFPLHCPLETRVGANFHGVTYNRPVGEISTRSWQVLAPDRGIRLRIARWPRRYRGGGLSPLVTQLGHSLRPD